MRKLIYNRPVANIVELQSDVIATSGDLTKGDNDIENPFDTSISPASFYE